LLQQFFCLSQVGFEKTSTSLKGASFVLDQDLSVVVHISDDPKGIPKVRAKLNRFVAPARISTVQGALLITADATLKPCCGRNRASITRFCKQLSAFDEVLGVLSSICLTSVVL
jgi:hypothetical protein